ncbi:lysylphosphatidylglycerol synthase transmembrane domain-containing protein [Convivina praedatoris]|uniref:Phosphatidylglycerol lysyltransferase n=1 Tax=Convivina praedatoris TaxID=2880963 RepID=A0ABM9D086_9LACO|nr:lysylphosphatidylglycerol synthase transmembrane domain-containing protein [Convivina sp. LMG 32447]CAH1850069.1 hypothetical protein R078138_00061 [Convivina sp. LMG 32447]CAH1851116.1 hypothetical protein LMG032447_00271 [Convivina sp. LMG 32447]CAH1851129.1 hypothetical protein R077815_00269 [Convivina sp. LMG 32447]
MSKRNQISAGIVVILTAVTVYYLVQELKGKGKQLEEALRVLDWRWLAAGLVMMVVSILLEAMATRALMSAKDQEHIHWTTLIKVPLMNLLGSGLTPFASGGQPAQLFALAKAKIETGRALSTILMKFLVYQIVVVLFFIVAYGAADNFIYQYVDHTFAEFIPFAIFIHAIVIVGILLVMFWPAFTLKLVHLTARLIGHFTSPKHYQKIVDSIEVKINNFHFESRRVIKNKRALLESTFWTVLQLVVFYMIPYFVIRAFGYPEVNPWLIVTMNIMIVMVISLFPVPGGVGGAELSFKLLFTPFVSNPATLILVILLWRLITYYFGIFAGIIAYILPTKQYD